MNMSTKIRSALVAAMSTVALVVLASHDVPFPESATFAGSFGYVAWGLTRWAEKA